MVVIRRATLADKEAIFSFIRTAYAGRWQFKIPHRWQWGYVDNPFLEDERLPIFIAVSDEGAVVGQICVLVEPVKLGNEITRAGWGADFFVLPEYRNQGIGTRLQQLYAQATPLSLGLAMAGRARRIKSRLGFNELDPVVMYTMPLRYTRQSIHDVAQLRFGRTARRTRKALQMGSGLASKRKGLRKGGLTLPIRADHSDFSFSIVDSFGWELDSLWHELSSHFFAAVTRTQEYLNWAYVKQPHAQYMRILMRRNGLLSGYLVCRTGQPPEPKVGIVTDLMVNPEDGAAIGLILHYAVKKLREAGATYAVGASSLPAYQEAFLKAGFKPARVMTPLARSPMGENRSVCDVTAGGWLFGKGDHDWDQFPLAPD